jgi:Flp pilus assembly protein TadD
MRTRTIIAILIALILTIAGTALWSATTTERDGNPDANVIEDSGSAAGSTNATDTKKGNKVARALAAPFKVFGKLFGHKDKNKLARMTEKDAEKFESVGVTRVDDNQFADQKKLISGSAREHLTAGRAFLKNGQINEAIAELSTAASMDPKLAEAHSLLGVAFDQKGLHDRAKESYEKAIHAEPEDAQALNNLGFSLYQSGKYRAAIDRLKRAAKLAPNDERILNNLALAYCRIGKFEDAYKHFARAGGELTGRLNTASMLERLGRDDEAIKYYEAARRIDPKNAIAEHRLAELYQRTGRIAPVSQSTNASESTETAMAHN